MPKAHKAGTKRKRTAKKNNPSGRSTRKTNLGVVAKRKSPTPPEIFERINARWPLTDEELAQWLASPEGKAAMMFEQTVGEKGRSQN